jgi:hypothetical protein
MSTSFTLEVSSLDVKPSNGKVMAVSFDCDLKDVITQFTERDFVKNCDPDALVKALVEHIGVEEVLSYIDEAAA